MNNRFMAVAAVALTATLALPTTFASTNTTNTNALYTKIMNQNPGLDPQAIKLALDGYQYALNHGDVKNPNYLTVINFNKPSYEKRLKLIDLQTGKIVMNLLVAQGKNTGLVYAKNFSNVPQTKESSLGVYTTLNTYHGHHGLSMRINGLEQGINNNAFRRDIVVHPAWYVTPQFNKAHHRVGRSWGCFAIDPQKSKQYIDLTKGGSVIFAYANSENHDPNILDISNLV